MGLLGNIVYSTLSSKEKVEKYQQIIRDKEWLIIKRYIPKNSKFLDVGCGAGYTLHKANTELNCHCTGLDPEPGAHGVGRFIQNHQLETPILKGFAEELPFEDNSFDVVFSSHVLEHVNNEQQSLKEMKRVLKKDGILIISMPTTTMTFLALFSNYLFTSHIKIYEFIVGLFTFKFQVNKLLSIILPRSHSYPRAKYISYDLKHYSVKNWTKTLQKEFVISEKLEPFLYPYPDFPQFFKIHHSKIGASSVFFICKKVTEHVI